MRKTRVYRWVMVAMPFVGGLVALAILGFMLLPAHGALGPPSNALEQPDFLGISKIHDLITNVSFLPEKILQFELARADFGRPVHLRIVSAVFGIISVAVMYSLLKLWQTKRIALLGTILFAGSSWFLHQSRQASPEVMYLAALPMLLLAGAWLQDKRYDKRLPLSAFMIALCLYLPGLWFFVMVGLIITSTSLVDAWKQTSKKIRGFSLGTFVLTASPLLYSLITQPSQLTNWVGLPSNGLLSLDYVTNNLYDLPKQLFVDGPNEAIHWLVGTPILDVFVVTLFILGGYSYFKGEHTSRAWVLAVFGLCSIAFICLGGAVSISLLLPLVYIVAINGAALLLQQWFTVFPNNPFARLVGLSCIIIATGVTVFYHTTRYYVAWPHATTTKKALNTEDR